MVLTGFVANGDWSQYESIGRVVGASVIVNNMALARSLKNAGRFVIHRFTNPSGFHDEGYNEHRNIPFQQYAEKLIQAHGYNNIDIPMSVGNEMSTGFSIAEYRGMCEYVAKAIEYIAEKGFTVYGWNSPPASHDAFLVNGGAYDPLIDVFHRLRNKAVMCFHDYDDFNLVRHFNDEKDYKRLDDRNYATKENWSKVINPSSSWHLYHYTRIIERARQLGKPIRAGITELGWSNIPDPNTQGDVNRLNAMFPRTPVNDSILNGQMTLGAYWAHVYPNWSLEDVVREQLAHYLGLVRQFYPEVEFAVIYAYRYGQSHGQDVSDQTVSSVISLSQTSTPPLVGRDMWIRSAGNWNVNVRSAPTTSTSIIGSIGRIDTPITFYETVNGWHKILWNNQVAYASAQHTTLTLRAVPEWVYVTAQYRYNKNDLAHVGIHNQIQDLIGDLS